MPAGSSPVSTGKRKRAGIACDFCRQRKLGCDNVKPACENCRFHGKTCTYSERVKKVRPTNVQIRQLEEENEELKISLSKLSSQVKPTADQMQNARNYQEETMTDDGIEGVQHLPDTPVSASANQQPPYLSTGDREVHFHGPSSAMFDESYHQITNSSNPGATADRSKSFQLLGACIKQRQMEPIDLAANRLDFDGVDPDLGMHLLSVFWNRQHAMGSLVYRPAFMRDMACNGPYFSKILLNAIYFAAAKNSTRAEFRCARIAVTNDDDNLELPAVVSPFRRRAEELLASPVRAGVPVPVSMKSEITTIQALLVMSDALFTWCDERSLSWLYSGLAINMIVDLGIHTDRQTSAMKKDFPPEHLEVRRRLFWAAFVQDKVQALYQGRPARLRWSDVNVPISFLDDYEELEQFSALSYSAVDVPTGFSTRSVSIFEQLCKLSIIMDKILSSIYGENFGEKNVTTLLSIAQSLHSELEHWRKGLPEHLDMNMSNSKVSSSLTPHALSLMSMFHSLVILLHRPFVSDGHIRGTSASVIRDAFTTCAAAASAIDGILRVFLQQFCITTVPYFMSYATYVSGTIHVRIAAQNGQGSEAHQSLQNCLNVLSEQQGVCRAPRRARQILLRLARRLNVSISEKVGVASTAGGAKQNETENNGSDVSTITTGPGAGINTPISATQDLDHIIATSQSDFDLMMSELDIDAIIQSFDFEQTINAEQVDQLAAGSVSKADSNINLNIQDNLPSAGEANTDNYWSYQDPLFGYDSFLMDDTLIF
ncbi:hypothetical protein UA08_02308 [Talaromyces atroroseus]|uniref:Zn(2)-C6 fungal-type domain-containing protein n=1 Tax=Talaromyces atroroseus TaxID=1441469 RepID=A0A225AN24_TALAT|nr:hypothetical protein UA08_02308 [Talaromyces atroroseus]OKL62290.1 hypothetical protein UA08_02308 [Talaromyces atroroseus]